MKPSELLTDESKWCRGYFAQDADGFGCYERDKSAVRWCLVGALRKCYGKDAEYLAAYDKVYEYVPNDPHGKSLAAFNDNISTTFMDVRKLLLKAGE